MTLLFQVLLNAMLLVIRADPGFVGLKLIQFGGLSLK